MKIYHYPVCTTCKRALKFLDEEGLSYEEIDIKSCPPSEEELETMLEHIGDVRKLFNTSGQLYRELQLKDKLPTMTKEEALKLLASNGMLVKRPFLLDDAVGLVGFKEPQWRDALL